MTIFSYLREPLWLLLAWLPLILLAVTFLLKHRRSHRYADPAFNDWVLTTNTAEHKHRFRQLLFTQLAWLAFAVAIAGPRLPEKIHDSQQQFNKDVMVVVDVSLSMSARDIKPSRLERAKLELLDLVERMDNMRLGVVVYAARPHLLSPPSADKQVLRFYLKSLRKQLLPTEGSGLFEALHYTIQYFARQKAAEPGIPRAIILLTDGEVNLTATQTSLAIESLTTALKQQGIHLYTLGIGTAQGAPLLSEQSGWLEFEDQAIVSKLEQTLLTKLANLGNGTYSPVSDDDSDWNQLYDNGVAALSYQTTDESLRDQILWQEKYHWFVIAGLLFLLLGLRQPGSRYHVTTPVTAVLLTVLTLSISFGINAPVYAVSDNYKRAFEKYQQGDYQAAREAFAAVPGYSGRVAEGSMAYQLEQYQQAIPAFIQAILDADNDQQRITAIFNLANSYFKLGKYAQAERLYRDVLRYQADFEPAQINLSYAIALKKKSKEQPGMTAQRQAKGPRLADAPENMDISTGKVTLGDAETKAEESKTAAFDLTPATRTTTGLKDSAPASAKVEQIKDETWTYDIDSLSQLQQRNPRIQTDESILWQRLFEVEEDFEAAQDQPNTLPGVKPW